MMRADAHLHFFYPGYVSELPPACRRSSPNELALYRALAELYQIQMVLAVGYEAEPWATGNNAYLAQLAAMYHWLKPVAFVQNPAALDLAILQEFRARGFVGLSFYLFSEDGLQQLQQVNPQVWQWLVAQRWLISANGRGPSWTAWRGVLERQPQLRLLVSHLGLPPRRATLPSNEEAWAALASVLALAAYPQVYVKLSGLYALSDPGYDYPHQVAWPYITALLDQFGARRLLWGSDFSPSLEWVSFQQTFAVLDRLPMLDATARTQIAGQNLIRLLGDVMSDDQDIPA